MSFKVHGGTAKGFESLCNSCRYSTRIQGFADSQEVVLCGGAINSTGNIVIKWPVARCNQYMTPDFIHQNELKEIAIILDGTHKRTRGFQE